jgi:PhzF family phenazine biosynthesis protein
MAQKIYQVDSFTSRKFSGNPAGVCVLEAPAEESWMKQIAAEMNLSETAFLHPEQDGFRLRWFTPVTEVELCGHATLASAHILWEQRILKAGDIARFHTMSGLLVASQERDGIRLNFPALMPEPGKAVSGINEALGIKPVNVERSKFDLLVEVECERDVVNLQPDFGLLKKVDARGFIVTAKAESGHYDFVSRFFAPAVGIDEDPVTGSAHCRLGPYWQSRLGKSEFNAYQASRRGGEMRVIVEGDRVNLIGHAVTVFEIAIRA